MHQYSGIKIIPWHFLYYISLLFPRHHKNIKIIEKCYREINFKKLHDITHNLITCSCTTLIYVENIVNFLHQCVTTFDIILRLSINSSKIFNVIMILTWNNIFDNNYNNFRKHIIYFGTVSLVVRFWTSLF